MGKRERKKEKLGLSESFSRAGRLTKLRGCGPLNHCGRGLEKGMTNDIISFAGVIIPISSLAELKDSTLSVAPWPGK